MKTTSLTALAMLFVAAVSGLDKPLDIKVTKTVTCEKKSQKGDKIEVHYRGTLEADGTYECSTLSPIIFSFFFTPPP